MENDKYIGRMLDNRYEILEVIGTGGMAVVYKARCHRLNRLVAVKILKDDNLEDEDFRRRFHAESQAVAMLSHPNIVSVYDVSTSLMADYIVMELIEGITLKQYMEKKGVLNWKETLHFAMQIAKALEHAHSKGIVHRDIKPHNVMVLKNGSVKVMDFGIARMISGSNTLTKEALGSVHYISPEQARGGRVDDRSDIYSLGVVMYEMMAGRPPYDGESPVSVAIQHINGGAALPSVLNPNIPGGLEQIIMKAMAHSVADRYPSCTRMLADMDEFRKDPTKLFDYTGLPLDAAMRMQNPHTTPVQPEPATDTPAQPQPPRRKPTPTPEQRKEEAIRRKHEQNAKEHQEQNKSKATTLAIIICSIVLVVALAVLLIIGLGGGKKDEPLTVPKLVGQMYDQLESHPGFKISHKKVYSDTEPAGKIISQEPAAGTKVDKEKNTIVVVVSKGPETKVVVLENLVNRSQEATFEYLTSVKLKYEIKAEYNDDIPENNIIKTEPQADSKLNEGQTVTLWISKGKKIEFGGMPNVVNNTEAEARKILNEQSLNLNIIIEKKWSTTIPEGIVIETTPTRGERLKSNQDVTLIISGGMERHVVPDMYGMTVLEALDWFRQHNYVEPIVEYVESDQKKDTIVGQSLAKDQEHLITVESITLQLSDGSKVPVTQDVTLDLGESALYNDCYLKITLEGKTAFAGRVPKGTMTITLPNQTAAGLAKFHIVVDDTESWDQEVLFAANE